MGRAGLGDGEQHYSPLTITCDRLLSSVSPVLDREADGDHLEGARIYSDFLKIVSNNDQVLTADPGARPAVSSDLDVIGRLSWAALNCVWFDVLYPRRKAGEASKLHIGYFPCGSGADVEEQPTAA